MAAPAVDFTISGHVDRALSIVARDSDATYAGKEGGAKAQVRNNGGSAYSDTTGVFGIGHGAGTSSDFTFGSYFGSLDASGRTEMIRYDSPAIGPMSAAVSVANGDQLLALLALRSEFAGTSFGAKIATLQSPVPRDSRRGPNPRAWGGQPCGRTP